MVVLNDCVESIEDGELDGEVTEGLPAEENPDQTWFNVLLILELLSIQVAHVSDLDDDFNHSN